MTNSRTDQPRVLTVAQLTQLLQRAVRDRFYDVWVSGEVSNLSRPQSGHIYLSLTGDDAQLRAVIWRSTAVDLTFDLADGLDVVCRGEIDIYPPRGTYQLIVSHIEPLGLGALQLAFRQLHAKLKAEGLFAVERKKPLPAFAKRIAIVTSPTGAALRDFLQVTSRRWENLEWLIVPCRVQGEEAAAEISRAIQIANRLSPLPDVLVVTRGGGSMEDLWAFNDERVVRCMCASQIPTISAVGHEIDVTLSDLAADVRALTPSEAGELVVPVKTDLVEKLSMTKNRMDAALQTQLEAARRRLAAFAERRVLSRPQELIHVLARRTDELEIRLHHTSDRLIERGQQRISNLASRLETISPLNVLARGYSVTQTLSEDLIMDSECVKSGDRIITRLARGKIESVVDKVESDRTNPPSPPLEKGGVKN